MRKKRGNKSPSPGRPKRPDADPNFCPTQKAAAEFLRISRGKFTDSLTAHPEDAPKFYTGKGYKKSELAEWASRHGITRSDEEKELRVARARLQLKREEFEFDQMRERMIPVSQMDLVLFRLVGAFKAAALAYGQRINEQLDGLDFNDRSRIFDSETAILLRTLEKPDYLHPVEDENDELE